AANFRLPILTAPGSGGFSPAVSLEYNSRLPNGVVGVGWQIGGLSAVTRCAQTYEQDGLQGIRGVSITPGDRFCLDGQRLMVIAGTYGANGAEYRTEIDSFSRIVSYGVAGSGPLFFRVWHADGSVSEYGNTDDSRLETRLADRAGTVLSWARNRSRDSSGNYIDFLYHKSSGVAVEHSIQSIRYTGNIRAGTSPYAEIRFVYASDRPDLSESFVSGERFLRRRLLERVDSLARVRASDASFTPLRSYFLSYGQDGFGRKVVESIEECSEAQKRHCFKPLIFDWLKTEHSISGGGVAAGNLFSKDFRDLAIADVNGDGRQDLLIVDQERKRTSFRIAFASADTGFRLDTQRYEVPVDGLNRLPVRLTTLDLNADGFDDIVYPRESAGTVSWVARLSDETGFGSEQVVTPDCCGTDSPRLLQVMDFNGDGLGDLLTNRVSSENERRGELVVLLNGYRPGALAGFEAPRSLSMEFSRSLFATGPSSDGWVEGEGALRIRVVNLDSLVGARPFDYNADGKVDLVARISRRYVRCSGDCTTVQDAASDSEITQEFEFEGTDEGSGDSPENKGDEYAVVSFYILFESDGEGRYVQREILATGAGAECGVVEFCEPWAHLPAARRLLPMDINADGLADIVYMDGFQVWHHRLNTGLGFETPVTVARPAGAPEAARGAFIDINGDAYPDFIYPEAVGFDSANWMVHINDLGNGFAAAQRSEIRHGNRDDGDASILLDFDGDGMLDNLFIDLAKSRVNGSTTRIYPGKNLITGRRQQPSNLVSGIRSGSGALTRLHYRPLTDESVYTRFRSASQLSWGRGSAVFDLVVPVQVVSGVSVSAPTATDPLATSEVEYHYAGARLQTGGRGFLGFAEVVSWNPQSGIRNNTRYRQDFPFIGLPLDSSRSLASAADAQQLLSDPAVDTVEPLAEVTESLSPPPVGDETVLLEYSATQWAGTETKAAAGSWWPSLTKSFSQSYTLAGNLQRKVLVTNSYASYGKLVKTVTDNWSPDSSQPVYTQTTEQSWHAADLNRWILRKPALTRVSHARPGTPVITRETGFSQDAETGRTVREVVEPDRAQYSVASDFILDDFGNRIRTTVTAENVAARNSRTVYDSLGRFPVRTLNHFGQATLTVEDWDAFGTALKTRNIDAVLSLAATDPMGRVFAQWTATGASVRTTQRLGAGKYCPGGTALHTITAPAGGAKEINCQDILGREIRGATEGFDGRFVNIDRRYDSLGQAAQVSEPYYADEPQYWNRMSYDALGRLLTLDTAGGDSERRSYDEQAGGPCVAGQPGAGSVIDALGQQSTEVRNVLDEKVSAYDSACGQVRYEYDAIGNLTRTTGADGVPVSMGYDLAGRRLWIDDPDKGYWQYRWNALGEMLRQLDAKRQAWDFRYDALGRVVERLESSAVDSLLDQDIVVRHRELRSWQNATTSAGRGKGQAVSVIYQDVVSGNTVQRLEYGYDDFGRRTSSTDSRGALQFSEAASFDEYGRNFQIFDASGDYRGIQYTYNSYGYVYKLSESRDHVAGPVFQRVRAMDARGNATFVELGNGVELFADYDPATGVLEKQQAYDVNGLSLQDVEYLFDAVGNLLHRHDRSNGRDLLEEFSYDALNRLSRVELTAPAAGVTTALETMALSYGSSGNISWKSDVGNYQYGEGTAGPHAVSRAGGVSYSYDANGNQVAGDGRSIEYSLFDKPLRIEKTGQSLEFSYGAGRQRIMRIDRSPASGEKITHYAGAVEYLEEPGGVRFRRYLGGVAIAEFFPSTGVSRSRYLVKDHLGSIHSMTTDSGKVEDATWMSFNAFGERRSVDWTAPLAYSASAALNDLTRRGFSGHEHADGLGVVHMNGRIYDPKLGRFLQADPYVQGPGDSQSLNRYSYVLNNPLSFTDPSGYFLKRLIKRWGRLALAIGLSVLLPGPQGFLAVQFGVTNVYLQAAITGFVAGAISSGSLKGAVIGAVIAVAVTGIVQAYSTSTPGSELASADRLAPEQSSLEHLYGPNGPPEGFYRIEVGDKGVFKSYLPISTSEVESFDVLYTNGIKNGFRKSILNAT
ncbi:MAG: RHS repeat-associated core domain-containing protein, partial [Xanthomonadales bacterium]|nr:RHS repeat-associated core domain-containing protein [Xanthomonadales bacterium]